MAPALKEATTDAIQTPIYESKEQSVPKGQTTMFEPESRRKTEGARVAKVLTEEPKVNKKASKIWSMIQEHFLDNGMVFENLSKETGNRALEGKWNFIRYSQARAQRLIGNGTDGVTALKDIKKVVEKSGKTEQFYDYLYHKHNVDRMNLEDRFDNAVNKDADIEKELAADLVGDYLFSDTDFISNLSAQNRNVFQKIYDEIKYLCRVATAGSKEARELEKVKKAFEDAYKASGTAQTDTKYSLNIKHTDGTVEELADARGLTNEQAVEYLYQAKSGSLRRDTYIPVRSDTPQVLIDTLEQVNEHIENLSLVMNVDKAQGAMAVENPGTKTKKYGDNVRKHGLSPEEIVEIINNLDNPNTVIYQTNRHDKNGRSLPNSVAVFVEFTSDGREGLAAVEFENPRNTDSIGTEYGEVNYHTVVTVFEPDVERHGMPFDYVEELLSNPDNYELKIERRQPTESATGEKHPNTSNELPSFDANVAQKGDSVKYGRLCCILRGSFTGIGGIGYSGRRAMRAVPFCFSHCFPAR